MALLLGCAEGFSFETATSGFSTGVERPETLPTETGSTTTLPTTASPDPESFQVSLQDAVDALPLLSMVPCYGAWLGASADQDGWCPTWLGQDEASSTWNANCSTKSGTSYVGLFTTTFDQTAYVEANLRERVMDRFGPELIPGFEVGVPFEGPAFDGVALNGTALVHVHDTPTTDYSFGGDGVSTTVTHQGLTVRHHWLDAVCEAAVEADGTWLAAGLVPSIRISQVSAGDDRFLTSVTGSFTGLGGAFPTVQFDEVVLRPEGLAASAVPGCDAEPSGTIWLTDEASRPFGVRFDPDVACDGCGELIGYWGQSFGSACADFTTFLRPMGTTDLSGLELQE
ncbi:MAG: hypothetical protein H6738_11705 [Alphaproteobacteria bacterium]|nr:hypothetical protein [Alphaproteobacteria bacterium]MCB9697437.1 hypothetical protein [Alphaproteobacteria bacterium]